MIGDTEIPLFAPLGAGAWALFNLILSVIGVVFAALAGVRTYLRKRRLEDDELKYMDDEYIYTDDEREAHEEALEEEERRRKRRQIWLIVSIVAAVIAVILFIITQDMRMPMVFVDLWTPVHVVLLVIGIIACLLAIRRIRRDDDEEEERDGSEIINGLEEASNGTDDLTGYEVLAASPSSAK